MHYPDKTGRHEPYESRDSRADLWGPEAEMPPATRQQARSGNHPAELRSSSKEAPTVPSSSLTGPGS